jgi:hypothetical protein
MEEVRLVQNKCARLPVHGAVRRAFRQEIGADRRDRRPLSMERSVSEGHGEADRPNRRMQLLNECVYVPGPDALQLVRAAVRELEAGTGDEIFHGARDEDFSCSCQ